MTVHVSGDVAGKRASKENPLMITNVPFFKQRTDNASGTVTYFGYAVPGTDEGKAGWLIVKQTISGSVISLDLAEASRDFDQVWNDRATLSYS